MSKRIGRPRKYTDPNEKFKVYDTKKPNIRVSLEEKIIIEELRNYPIIFDKLYRKPELIPLIADFLFSK